MSGRYSQRSGQAGELVAKAQLRALGFEMIRKGSNAWKVTRWVRPYRGQGPGQAFVVPEARQRLESDWRAIEPGTGRSVFVEVKLRDDRLRWSDLQPHQRQMLDEHDAWGGLSLLVWVEGSDAHVLEWPVPGFGPRKSLTLKKIAGLELLP